MKYLTGKTGNVCITITRYIIFSKNTRERVCQSSITFKLVAGNYVIGVTSLNFGFILDNSPSNFNEVI